MFAGNRTDLGGQVALKFGIDVHDESVVCGELDPACPRLSQRKIAIGPILQPSVKLIAAPQPAAEDAALEIILGLVCCVLRNLVLREHQIDDPERAVQGSVRVFSGIAIVWLRQHADEKGRLAESEIPRAHTKIIASRIIEAIHVARMRHDIHVACKNLRPRKEGVDSDREHRLTEFPAEAVLFFEQQRSRQLLCQRASPLAATSKILPACAQG